MTARAHRTPRQEHGFVVVGVGNPLLSDDGAGIRALEILGRAAWLPPGVRLVDAGTSGPAVLAEASACDGLLVLDAVDTDGEPGDVVRFDLHDGLGGVRPRTVHDLGLRDLLNDLALMGKFPRHAVLFGIQPRSVALGTGLSPPVERGLETLVAAALGELAAWSRGGVDGQGGRTRT